MSTHKILSDIEIETALKGAPGWSRKGENIAKTFAFETFRDAIAYIVLVGIEAEMMNHHPEFHNSYNIISFAFCTHDVGRKITDTDIKLAERLNEIAKRFPNVK
ncbi:MAG TPA: 4a-hydroxytetrahydrobiopterin dehydratase [Roseiarcus sp.]|nr:4a-hydroxytetrahydrobiopterin dehydratase [Roseiarcus sp.]